MKKIIVDSHCDTALKLLNGKCINNENNQFTLNNALEYDKYIQFFAMYIEPEYVKSGEYDLCLRLIETVKNETKINNKYMQTIINKYQLEEYLNLKEKKIGLVLTIEDASCLEGKIDNLQKFYDEGIRIIGLTWNGKNQVASGADCLGISDEGLSKFGMEVVKKMNELGIVIDVSHLSEKSFYDVMKITKSPVMASHSCAKSICNHRRNLSDEQIKIISDNGGIIGVNFYADFLNKDKSKADIKCVVKHIKHIYNVGGNKCIGLGSDYDGMDVNKVATGLENNSKLLNLIEFLREEKFIEEDIDNIMWKNQIEFLNRVLK